MYEVPLITADNFVTYMLNGVSRGMIIFLVASGLTLIFGLIGLINFAHGAMLALGGYGTYVVLQTMDNFWLGLGISVVLVTLLGYVLERKVLYWLYDEPLLGFLGTFGIGLVIEEALAVQFGSRSYTIQSPIPQSTELLGVTYPSYRLFVILVGAVVAAGVGLLLTRTRLGLEIHATANRQPTAEILGVNTTRIYTVTFVLGTALAALAGALTAPITSIYPTIGLDYITMAFLVIIVGGMGSFKGSFVVSMIVGQTIAFGWLVLEPTYVRILVFVAAMVFILYKPRGFFGKPEVHE
ncbi:branched-chain amino acid ABC transporter permease [Halobellus clavatus]|jgi:branched-subunit amino acid ABC-type transport system permease component|uniref:Branched-chain amino acid transport system permease protein n=1 Tax=Halobellus clavatus TaxID=660517 RepID=A0A1H3FVB1_9EURY|nr:branched-chain amino acid ABC transporter permease [Halobellus clavatus]SDX94936.1 branched-chain amino acid transport system permease protein [Halobellus clavatus]